MGLVKLSYLNSAVGAYVKVDMTAAIKVLHSLVAWFLGQKEIIIIIIITIVIINIIIIIINGDPDLKLVWSTNLLFK